MRTETINNQHRVILNPGEYYASNSPVTISTLLGSCVSACLFDPVNRVIGMNHFMLSHERSSKNIALSQTEAGRYGIHSMELLINQMLQLGAEKRFMKAKAFGGSSLIYNGSKKNDVNSVGAVNSTFIREFLRYEGIPLIAENLGGNAGRVIHFFFGDFAVYMRKLDNANKGRQLATRDRECWLNTLLKQKKRDAMTNNVELWK